LALEWISMIAKTHTAETMTDACPPCWQREFGPECWERDWWRSGGRSRADDLALEDEVVSESRR